MHEGVLTHAGYSSKTTANEFIFKTFWRLFHGMESALRLGIVAHRIILALRWQNQGDRVCKQVGMHTKTCLETKQMLVTYCILFKRKISDYYRLICLIESSFGGKNRKKYMNINIRLFWLVR